MKYLSSLILLVIIFLTPASVEAQTCGVFHKKVDDLCVHFDVPSNAHLTYSGNSWDCNRGFKRSSDGLACQEIEIPNNATGNLIGSFNCNSGFRKIGEECKKVTDIENGKFYTQGADFYCNNGYEKNETERKCDKIKLPDNAHEDFLSLEGWSCNSTFTREGDHCKEFTLPEHGFWFNNNWGCELGFRKNPTNKTCDKISLPENAHYTNTFDGWVCNDGFVKNYKENRCDKSN